VNDVGGTNNFLILLRTFKAATGSSGPANVKTVQGLAIASVKTAQGLAIASVKTVQGLN
jgi:hypothetical protein